MSEDATEVGRIGRQANRRIGATGWLLFLFVIVLVVTLALNGPEGAMDAISRVGISGLLVLMGLVCVHYVIRAIRWHVLVRVGGVDTGFLQNTRHFLGGFAMTATPGRVGELVRLRWLKLETGHRFGTLVPIAFADRALELAAMVVVIAGALAFASLGTTSTIWLLLVGFGVVALCSPQLLSRGIGLLWLAIGRRAPRLFAKLRRMARSLALFTVPKVLLPIIAIGALGWLMEGIAFWLVLDWLEIPLPLPTATAIFLCAILSGALLGLPGGLGGVEGGAVLLLVLQGVPADTALLATVIIRLTTLWFAVLVGFVVFPYAEYRAVRAEPGDVT